MKQDIVARREGDQQLTASTAKTVCITGSLRDQDTASCDGRIKVRDEAGATVLKPPSGLARATRIASKDAKVRRP
jgi:hypothetical protein